MALTRAELEEQVIQKERELIAWFIDLSEEVKAKIFSSFGENDIEEELRLLKIKYAELEQNLVEKNLEIEELVSTVGELQIFGADTLQKYDVVNYEQKGLKDEIEILKKENYGQMDTFNKIKYKHEKLLITHAWTNFCLEKAFIDKNGDVGQCQKQGSTMAAPVKRATRRGVVKS